MGSQALSKGGGESKELRKNALRVGLDGEESIPSMEMDCAVLQERRKEREKRDWLGRRGGGKKDFAV